MTRLEAKCLQFLACCDVANMDEAVIGDLLEERHEGKSLLWFLRETLTLLVAGVWRQIAADKARSAGAILMGLGLSFVLRTLLARILEVAGIGVLPAFVIASIAFAVTGIAIRYKFPRHSVAMAAAFTAYALLAKLSLVLMNFDSFHSASNPAHFPLAVAAVTLPPICAVAGAVALEWNVTTFAQTEI